jgi:hypothetical protein
MCNLVLEGGLIQEIFGKINTFSARLSVAESDISLRNLCQEEKNHKIMAKAVVIMKI